MFFIVDPISCSYMKCIKPQRFARCSVLGARCSVLGARCSVLGARCLKILVFSLRLSSIFFIFSTQERRVETQVASYKNRVPRTERRGSSIRYLASHITHQNPNTLIILNRKFKGQTQISQYNRLACIQINR
jgi:hypothetical protein